MQQEISDVLSRIDVLNHIYNQLHSSSDVEKVDLGGYLSSLCTSVISFTNQINHRATVEVTSEIALVGQDVAVPLGLVATEFVTNSLKHTPADTKLKLSVSIHVSENQIVIGLSDNGPGLGDALSEKESKNTGSGILLMEGLLKQIKAKWEWTDGDGATLHIFLPVVETLSANNESRF